MGIWVRVLPFLTCEIELLESPGMCSLFITFSVNQTVRKSNGSVASCGEAATCVACVYSIAGCRFRAFCQDVAVPRVDRMAIRRTFPAVSVSFVSNLVPGNNAKLQQERNEMCGERVSRTASSTARLSPDHAATTYAQV